MKKGFTLIEMIGIIIVLAAIMIVVAPSLLNTLRNSGKNTYNSFKNNLKQATESYIVKNKDVSDNEIDEVNVYLSDLLEQNYIDEIPSIPADDPFAGGGESLEGGYVFAKKNTSGVYAYKLCKADNTCQDI